MSTVRKVIRYRFFSKGLGFWEDRILRDALNELHRNKFIVVEDNNTPEYIFVHCSWEAFRSFLHSYKARELRDKVTVFFVTEALHPDFGIFDYAISYVDADFRYLYSSDRYFVFGRHFGISDLKNLKKTVDVKQQFCNFIYSRPSASERVTLFKLLSNYKKVDALGSYLNNVGNVPDRWDYKKLHGVNDHWFASSVVQKSPYKFSIAFENSSIRGYVSEKIISSFLAGTVPIYWGNSSVSNMFYKDSFINCHDYSTFEEVVQRVKEIDQDDKLWLSMVNHPKIKPEYSELLRKQPSLYAILENLFAKEKKEVLVKPKGALHEAAIKAYYSKLSLKFRLLNFWIKMRHLGYRLHVGWLVEFLDKILKKVYYNFLT